jgi:hypothetical protein
MSVNLLEATRAGVEKIGRYFTVVSALPTVAFVLYVFVLIRAEGWRGPPRWSFLAHPSATQLLFIALGSISIALATHPIQFPMIQTLEGYWGTSRLARRLATVRIMYHRSRYQALKRTQRAPDGIAENGTELDRNSARWEQIEQAFARDESRRTLRSYPRYQGFMMPTQLGNVLRRYETTVGAAYGIDPIEAVPRLAVVAGEREIAYLQDQRTQLDLAVRMAVLAGAAAMLTLPLMWRAGLWMLLALVPYAGAWLAYRGAVAAAHDYGYGVAVLVDMGRFALYDHMRLEPVKTQLAETRINQALMKTFRHEKHAGLSYSDPLPVPPTEPSGSTKPPEPTDSTKD